MIQYNGTGMSRWCSYFSYIYNYLCSQRLLPITLWDRIPLRQSVLDTTLCDEICQWLAEGRWFSTGTPVSSTNKTDRHDITDIVLTVALSTISLTQCNGPDGMRVQKEHVLFMLDKY
jgi:hypothetical protein